MRTEIKIWMPEISKKSSQFQETDMVIRSNVRTMDRLALNIVTFTVGSLPILIVIAIATANLKNFTVLGEFQQISFY